MASHGVPRPATREERTAESRRKELQEIEEYQKLVSEVQKGLNDKHFGPNLLDKTSALLKKNPEYYSIWNVRRKIYLNEFESLARQAKAGTLSEDLRPKHVLDIINLDLHFLLPLLMQYPKCYWIWNHRIWLLQQATQQVPADKARSLWEDDLKLVNKMLTRDSRNFHGWGYRRTVVEALEDPKLGGSSMVREEYDYTTKMIGQDLSNFSAWHNRSQLILRILEEQNATAVEREKMLDDEIKLIQKALFDPYDQSLWFYHSSLMATLDPETSRVQAIAPDLTVKDRLWYVKAEKEFIEELVEDAEDSKWVYQALIECALIESRLTGILTDDDKTNIGRWLEKLEQLDPLRHGRWKDTRDMLLGARS